MFKQVRDEPTSYSVPAPGRSEADVPAKKSNKRGSRGGSSKRKSSEANFPSVIPAPAVSSAPLAADMDMDMFPGTYDDTAESSTANPSSSAFLDNDIDLGFEFDADEAVEMVASVAGGGVGEGAVKNAEAWDNFSGNDTICPEGERGGQLEGGTDGGWDDALEERKRNQALDAGLQMHRSYQQVRVLQHCDMAISTSYPLSLSTADFSYSLVCRMCCGGRGGEARWRSLLSAWTRREMGMMCQRRRRSGGRDKWRWI